jgi:predicted DNA-binding ribbon-helix-helix protein
MERSLRRLGDRKRYPLERYDVKWLRRIALLAILSAIALLIASPSIIHSRRVAHFESVCRLVASQGGSLSFDLQGDYWLTLNGVAASDETIQTLLPHLHTLPSGFTFIGPGEGRHFYVQLDHSNISARGLTDLCSLPITSIALTHCPNLDDDAVDALVTLRNPNAIIIGDIRLSSGALKRLRERMQNAFPNVRG